MTAALKDGPLADFLPRTVGLDTCGSAAGGELKVHSTFPAARRLQRLVKRPAGDANRHRTFDLRTTLAATMDS